MTVPYDDIDAKRDLNKNLVLEIAPDVGRKIDGLQCFGPGQPPTTELYMISYLCQIVKRKQWVLLCGIVILLILYANREKNESHEHVRVIHHSHVPGMKSYLVWSDQCKMPNFDPYEPEVMKFFKRQKYKPCSNLPPLTSVYYNDSTQRYLLQLHGDRLAAYSSSVGTKDIGAIDCCYEAIERPTEGANIDSVVNFSTCIHFERSTMLSPNIDSIIVSCYVAGGSGKRRNGDKPFYANGHALMPDRQELRERLQAWRQKNIGQRPSNVLMIGIDSISRINLIRAMPQTAQYLYDNEWFEMSGYNKIDDNTFPNLMAVLTGQNRTSIYSRCTPNVLGGLDNCTYIWDLFRKFGYVTAYGEDVVSINTFNYCKRGFVRPPVDHYMRPYLIGAESKLRGKGGSGDQKYCLGPQHSVEAVYDYALELVRRYHSDPFFGLFWTNSLSHDAIGDCTALDNKMVHYLQRFAELGALNNTVVIFFSDHGMRFGPTRKLYIAHYEERLPFLFLWLPPYLKQSHPEFVSALSVNKNRLTNPYDLHMTLRHVLALSGRVAPNDQPLLFQPIADCPRCHTLLQPVAHNRSCSEISIDDHWCTCIPFQSVYKKSKTIYKVVQLTVEYINNFVASFNNGSLAKLCVPLRFGSIEHAYRAQSQRQYVVMAHENMSSTTIYRVTFHTKPNQALFEATVRYNADTEALIVTGEISRLNSYGSDSSCTQDGAAKKYCSCHKHLI